MFKTINNQININLNYNVIISQLKDQEKNQKTDDTTVAGELEYTLGRDC